MSVPLRAEPFPTRVRRPTDVFYLLIFRGKPAHGSPAAEREPATFQITRPTRYQLHQGGLAKLKVRKENDTHI